MVKSFGDTCREEVLSRGLLLWVGLLVIEAVNKPTRSSLVLLALKIVCHGTVYSLLLYLCAAPILIHVDVAHGLLQYYFHLDGIRYIMYLAHLQC